MGRFKKLSPEDVARLKLNDEKKSNKEWASYFDVSIVTIIHARTGKLAYAIPAEG